MRSKAALIGLGAGIIAALAFWMVPARPPAEPEKQPLGLMTSLPIYWSGGEMSDMLTSPDAQHWMRTALETRNALVLLDSLAQPDNLSPNDRLSPLRRLILAQPAALPPADLVALDSWVRGGGHALIFADPMLTEETDFGLGDKRRPQDMATLSPLFIRWGLTEVYDIDQAAAPGNIVLGTARLPVQLHGTFASPHPENCAVSGDGVVANCVIGKGRAVIVLDAHVIEAQPGTTAKTDALNHLMAIAFTEN